MYTFIHFMNIDYRLYIRNVTMMGWNFPFFLNPQYNVAASHEHVGKQLGLRVTS